MWKSATCDELGGVSRRLEALELPTACGRTQETTPPVRGFAGVYVGWSRTNARADPADYSPGVGFLDDGAIQCRDQEMPGGGQASTDVQGCLILRAPNRNEEKCCSRICMR